MMQWMLHLSPFVLIHSESWHFSYPMIKDSQLSFLLSDDSVTNKHPLKVCVFMASGDLRRLITRSAQQLIGKRCHLLVTR